MTTEDKINYVLDSFDFECVHKAMVALKWKWHIPDDEPRVPCIFDLRQAARKLLNAVVKEKVYRSGTGGFHVINHDGVLTLQFIVSESDTLGSEEQNDISS